MAAPISTHLPRIRRLMPELEISSVHAGEDGLVNDVLVVNDEWVFRFARTEAGGQALAREARLLDLIRRHVSLRVPEVVGTGPDGVVCRFIPGVPLTRHVLLAEGARTRAALLEELGRFLQELHAIPVTEIHLVGLSPDTPAKDEGADQRRDAERLYHDLERELLPHMMAWARTWAREHFRPVLEGRLDLGFTPTVIHGDLAPYHLCYDPRTRRLAGVIDFGEAGPGDPAADLGLVIHAYGESLLGGLAPAYSGLEDLVDRARFLAGTLELRWGLAAIRSRDPAWFLCHLGYARDSWPIGWRGGRA